jgi:hypothetical protein
MDDDVCEVAKAFLADELFNPSKWDSTVDHTVLITTLNQTGQVHELITYFRMNDLLVKLRKDSVYTTTTPPKYLTDVNDMIKNVVTDCVRFLASSGLDRSFMMSEEGIASMENFDCLITYYQVQWKSTPSNLVEIRDRVRKKRNHEYKIDIDLQWPLFFLVAYTFRQRLYALFASKI